MAADAMWDAEAIPNFLRQPKALRVLIAQPLLRRDGDIVRGSADH
jgi:hypothetical protein